MPLVDAFFEFISEGLNEEGVVGLTVIQTEAGWSVGSSRGVFSETTLPAALNAMSRAVDFTHKDLQVAEEPSLLKRVAELAGPRGVVVHLLDGSPQWCVTVENDEMHERRGVRLDDVLREALEVLLGECT